MKSSIINYLLFALFVLVLAVTLGRIGSPAVRAQAITAATPGEVFSSGLHTNCLLAPANQGSLCLGNDGLYVSFGTTSAAATAWTCVSGPSCSTTATVALTINGIQKTLPAAFTIAAATAQPTSSAVVTTTAPATTVSVQ